MLVAAAILSGAHHAGKRTSNWFDYCLTALAFSVGCYYGTISVIEAITSSYSYPRLLPMSLAFVGFGLWDLVTYFRPIDSFRVAAITHGCRLFAAWWMLIVGMLIRQGQHVAAGEGGSANTSSAPSFLFCFLSFCCTGIGKSHHCEPHDGTASVAEEVLLDSGRGKKPVTR